MVLGLIMEHSHAKFGDSSCVIFLRHREGRQTNAGENPSLATAVHVGNRTRVRT